MPHSFCDPTTVHLCPTAYYEEMGRRGRLLRIGNESDETHGTLTYFLASDLEHVERLHRRTMWSTPPEDAQGSWCYVDKLLALDWNVVLHRTVEDVICKRHPKIRWAAWHRPTQTDDRLYTCRVGGSNGTDIHR